MPLIEKVMDKGLAAYVQTISEAEIHTFFYKE
jgi:hypothetical protein